MDLNEEKSNLLKRLEEIKQLEEDERKKKLELGISIEVTKFLPDIGIVGISLSAYRDDIVNLLRQIPSRNVINEVNTINIKHFPFFKDNVLKLEKVNWISSIHDTEINQYFAAPDFKVDIFNAIITIKAHIKAPRLNGYTIRTFKSLINNEYRIHSDDTDAFDTLQAQHKDKIWELSAEYIVFYHDRNARRDLFEAFQTMIDAPEIETPEIIKQHGFDLTPDQRVAIKYGEATNFRFLCSYDMGKGKTLLAIAIAERFNLRTLFICKANLKTNIFLEIKKFTGKRAIILAGIEPTGLAMDLLNNPRNQYFIINYDIIGRGIKNKEGEIEVMKWPPVINMLGKFDLFVPDEAHYMKNIDTNRSKGSRAIETPKVVPLTGTAIVNRPEELFPILNMIDKDKFSSYSSFKQKYQYSDGTARNAKELFGLLKYYMIRRMNDHTNVHPMIRFSELDDSARKIYEKALEGLYIALRKPDYQREINNVLTELLRLKQITASAKLDVTVDLAEEALENTSDHEWNKVLIFSQFKEVHSHIQEKLGKKCAIINGDIGNDERYRLINEFQNKQSPLKVIVSNIEEGLTLTEAYTVIFNDHTWTPKTILQFRGRAFNRTNDPHGGNSYDVLCPNTIDETIEKIIERKLNTIAQVIEGKEVEDDGSGSIIKDLLKEMRGE